MTGCVILDVLTIMLMKIPIFWDIMPFNTIFILRDNTEITEYV
jgi:hypothetical protein